MEQKFKLSSTIHCDVLIIGAGGAGLRCAAHILEKRPGTHIIAVTKVSHPQKSHTSTAQGGLAAVDPNDSVDKPIYHMFDTWKGSDCMADQDVVRKIVDAAWEEIVWLENKGMHFTRDEEGRLSKRTFGGHTVRFGEASALLAPHVDLASLVLVEGDGATAQPAIADVLELTVDEALEFLSAPCFTDC